MHLIIELIIEFFAGYVLKGLGVTLLYLLGRIAFFFSPSRQIYSFNTIWNIDFDKDDAYWQAAEEFSQKLIGAVVLGVICYLFVIVVR